MNGQQDIK